MKKLFLMILVTCSLLGNKSFSATVIKSEYIGNDIYKLEMNDGCIYQGELFTTMPKIKLKNLLKKANKTFTYHGNGVEDCTRSSNGYLKDGKFIKGNFVSGFYKDNSGYEKMGTFVNGFLQNGYSKAPNGAMLEGSFLNGKLNGKGRYTDSDGSFWEGNYENGYLIGKANYYDAQEKVTWKGNSSKGTGILTFVGSVKKYYDNGKIETGKCDINGCNFSITKSLEDIKKTENEKESKKKLYKKIYNKCILENLKGQTDKEAIKIIKETCKDKAENPSMLDKLFN
jgi:hypothetical protein